MTARRCLSALLLATLFLTTACGRREVLGFEDLPGGQHDLPVDYAGLTWDPHFDHYDYLQWPLDPCSSGETRLIYGRWIDFGAEVTFKGSWVGRFAWGGDVYWRGYRAGELVYTSPALLDGTETSGWIRVHWPRVDRVEMVHAGGNVAVDDITYLRPFPGLPDGCGIFRPHLLRLLDPDPQ